MLIIRYWLREESRRGINERRGKHHDKLAVMAAAITVFIINNDALGVVISLEKLDGGIPSFPLAHPLPRRAQCTRWEDAFDVARARGVHVIPIQTETIIFRLFANGHYQLPVDSAISAEPSFDTRGNSLLPLERDDGLPRPLLPRNPRFVYPSVRR